MKARRQTLPKTGGERRAVERWEPLDGTLQRTRRPAGFAAISGKRPSSRIVWTPRSGHTRPLSMLLPSRSIIKAAKITGRIIPIAGRGPTGFGGVPVESRGAGMPCLVGMGMLPASARKVRAWASGTLGRSLRSRLDFGSPPFPLPGSAMPRCICASVASGATWAKARMPVDP